MIPKKYPQISNIRVDDNYGLNDKLYFKVYLPVKYGEDNFDHDDVRDDVREYAKYVLGKNESVDMVLFVQP
jgi:hypothetical protein